MTATAGFILCLVSYYIGRWTGRNEVYLEMIELIGGKYGENDCKGK